MATPRELKRIINPLIGKLEMLDPYCEDPVKFQAEIDKINGILESKEVSQDSSYRTRLKVIQGRAIEAVKQREEDDQPAPEIKKDPLKIYAGLLKGIKIKILAYQDRFFLKRFNENNTDNSYRWKFNPLGRVESLDLTTRFGSYPIVSIRGNQSLDWNFSEIDCYPIPNKSFRHLKHLKDCPKDRIYEFLLRLGHDSMNTFLMSLRTGAVYDRPGPDPEIALSEVINNPDAMKMIRESASIFPTLEMKGLEKYAVRYGPYRKRK